jgi:Kef-type K+ transport system membrane component KefB
MNLAEHPIFVVMLAAVLAPLLAELPLRLRVPVVVFEVVLGVIVGPQVLGLIERGPFLDTMQKAGMAAVLFMAGMEIDFERMRGRPLALATRAWVVSLALALLCVAVLHVVPGVNAPLMVTIALATTGLGVLLPRMRDEGQLDTDVGRLLFAAGAAGEVAPILAVSLALSHRYSSVQELLYLIGFLAVIGIVAAVGMGVRPPRLLAYFERTLESSSQVPVRLAILMMAGTFVLSEVLGFEGILGAFAAGMVVGLATRGEKGGPFRARLDAVCFAWLTPFFFVGTGVAFNVGQLLERPINAMLVPLVLVLFLLVRGAPTLLYGAALAPRQRLPFALFASVPSLGLVIVVTEIGTRSLLMNADVAHALVGSALLATLVLPTLGAYFEARAAKPAPAA